MKRIGRLFDQVCSFGALRTAALNAAKGKKGKPRVAAFICNLAFLGLSLYQMGRGD